jgi:hypothetical protein
MAAETPTPSDETPVLYTTRRGLATVSFSFGLWGTLVFWWYPFGMAIATLGLIFGLIAVACGFRAKADGTGEPLAYVGIFLGATGLSLALLAYRFMQMAFEGGITGELYQ